MPTDAATAAEENLVRAIAIWAAAAEDGQVDNISGCTLARCAVPLRSFNQVLVRRQATDLPELVKATREYFRGVSGVFRLRIRDDVEPVADEPLIAAGLVRRGGIPCLSMPTSHADGASPLEIRDVVNEETLADHAAVVAEAFDWSPPELDRVFRPQLLDAVGWRAYVGYRSGVPVTTTQLVQSDNTAGLYYVGTVEHARRAGCGDAITRHAIAEAAKLGCSIVTLQASPMGEPMYERLGFTRASFYRTFVGA